MTSKNEKAFICANVSAIVLLALLTVSYYLQNLPNAPLITAIVVIMFEIAVPIEILKYLKISSRDFNIYAHNIDTIIDLALPPYGKRKIKPDFLGIFKELLVFLKVSCVVLLPYIIFYWGFLKLLAIKDESQLVFSFNLPPRLFYEIVTQIFVVALPEELFYRGFLQGAFLKKWQNRFFLWGLPLGRAVLLTNIIFALGHFVGPFAPLRLLTFFPGVIFSYLVYKNKSLLSAILFHATCNILGQILYGSFFLR